MGGLKNNIQYIEINLILQAQVRLPIHVSGCHMRLPHLFSRLDECTEFFPCVRQTLVTNAPAFEDPAMLDFCDCRMRLPQENFLLTSILLLFQQSSRKPSNKYNDVGRNLSSSTPLPDTWRGSCMRLPSAVRQPHAATGHMEWRP